jgi:hypothetical protein
VRAKFSSAYEFVPLRQQTKPATYGGRFWRL